MNKIRELKLKATRLVDHSPPGATWGESMRMTHHTLDEDLFAQLIVQECTSMLKEHQEKLEKWRRAECDFEIKNLYGVQESTLEMHLQLEMMVDEINKRFGIKDDQKD